MAKLKLPTTIWMDWFKNTTLQSITPWSEYFYINPDRQQWISNYQLWNEEWENGHWSYITGEPLERANKIRNKNLIPISPNTTYHQINGSGGLNIYFYDKNGNYLGQETYLELSGSDVDFITPDNAYFMNFSTFGSTTTIYNHNICISVSNPIFNGKYEPRIIKIEDILESLDLGDLDWTLDSFNNWVSSSLTIAGKDKIKCYCGKYPTVINPELVDYGSRLTISLVSIVIHDKDTLTMTSSEFKNHVKGIGFVYIKVNSPY